MHRPPHLAGPWYSQPHGKCHSNDHRLRRPACPPQNGPRRGRNPSRDDAEDHGPGRKDRDRTASTRGHDRSARTSMDRGTYRRGATSRLRRRSSRSSERSASVESEEVRRATALDASVIVAGLLSSHEHHAPAAAELAALLTEPGDVILPLQALVEAYSVMTRLPSPHRLSAKNALAVLVGSLRQRTQVVGLAGEEAWESPRGSQPTPDRRRHELRRPDRRLRAQRRRAENPYLQPSPFREARRRGS